MKKIMDNFYRWLAQRLPGRLIYWSVVRAYSFADKSRDQHGNICVPGMTLFEAIGIAKDIDRA